jgi:hypothetical protein
MSKDAFRVALALVVTAMLGLAAHVIIGPGRPAASPPAFMSPEWNEDFYRRLIDHCDRLPIGHPDRPADAFCRAPR